MQVVCTRGSGPRQHADEGHPPRAGNVMPRTESLLNSIQARIRFEQDWKHALKRRKGLIMSWQ